MSRFPSRRSRREVEKVDRPRPGISCPALRADARWSSNLRHKSKVKLRARQVGPANDLARIIDPPCFTIVTAESSEISEDASVPEKGMMNRVADEI